MKGQNSDFHDVLDNSNRTLLESSENKSEIVHIPVQKMNEMKSDVQITPSSQTVKKSRSVCGFG